jgi:hypothetical protein
MAVLWPPAEKWHCWDSQKRTDIVWDFELKKWHCWEPQLRNGSVVTPSWGMVVLWPPAEEWKCCDPQKRTDIVWDFELKKWHCWEPQLRNGSVVIPRRGLTLFETPSWELALLGLLRFIGQLVSSLLTAAQYTYKGWMLQPEFTAFQTSWKKCFLLI